MRSFQLIDQITRAGIVRRNKFHRGRLNAVTIDQIRITLGRVAHVELAGRIGAIVMASGGRAALRKDVRLKRAQIGSAGRSGNGIKRNVALFFGAADNGDEREEK